MATATAKSRAASTADSDERANRPGRKERAQARNRERLEKMRAKSGNRYRIHYDIDGPRVRLGMLWFVGAMAAFAAGPLGVTLYFGVAFAAAASHTLRTWRARGMAVEPMVALVTTAFVVVCALIAPPIMGIGMLALVVATVAVAARDVGLDVGAVLSRAGVMLQASLPTAVAGGCLVLLADLEVWAAIALVFLVSAYETGDYLVGSGSANAAEGPIAGAAAVLVMSLAVAALGIPPFGVGQAMTFGLAVAPLAFAGQLLASVMLPHSRAFAPALRRVDSLLLAAPFWYVGIDLFVL